jgi:hypothetical protein
MQDERRVRSEQSGGIDALRERVIAEARGGFVGPAILHGERIREGFTYKL